MRRSPARLFQGVLLLRAVLQGRAQRLLEVLPGGEGALPLLLHALPLLLHAMAGRMLPTPVPADGLTGVRRAWRALWWGMRCPAGPTKWGSQGGMRRALPPRVGTNEADGADEADGRTNALTNMTSALR